MHQNCWYIINKRAYSLDIISIYLRAPWPNCIKLLFSKLKATNEVDDSGVAESNLQENKTSSEKNNSDPNVDRQVALSNQTEGLSTYEMSSLIQGQYCKTFFVLKCQSHYSRLDFYTQFCATKELAPCYDGSPRLKKTLRWCILYSQVIRIDRGS